MNSPPIVEPTLVIGMFTGGYDLDFDPWPCTPLREFALAFSLWMNLEIKGNCNKMVPSGVMAFPENQQVDHLGNSSFSDGRGSKKNRGPKWNPGKGSLVPKFEPRPDQKPNSLPELIGQTSLHILLATKMVQAQKMCKVHELSE